MLSRERSIGKPADEHHYTPHNPDEEVLLFNILLASNVTWQFLLVKPDYWHENPNRLPSFASRF